MHALTYYLCNPYGSESSEHFGHIPSGISLRSTNYVTKKRAQEDHLQNRPIFSENWEQKTARG